MATYKGIQGYSVQKLATDPTASETAGQLWYNSTSGKFKIATEGAGSWSSGTVINTARRYMSGVGSKTAGLIFGGNAPGLNYTESYDGTTWTEVANTVDGLTQRGRAGTQTAALAGGGANGGQQNYSESWNGTSWTEVNAMVAATATGSAFGIQTAAIVAGGAPPATNPDSETWNGTCWTEGNNINNGRGSAAGCGIVTAGLMFGGSPPIATLGDLTESYDGTSWTIENTLNVGRYAISGSGTQDAGMAYGGGTPTWSALTELFDGTSWTEVGDLATARRWAGSSTVTGTDSAFLAGGLVATPASSNLTEEWANPVYTIKTVTVS